MKVLLDENVPETLTAAFDRCETLHVNKLGWQGKENGALLLAAQEAGLTAFADDRCESLQPAKSALA